MTGRLAVWTCILALAGPCTTLAEEPVPIGDIIENPDRYHFRLLTLQGTVRKVDQLAPYSPREDTTCYGAYTFQLDDGTGFLDIEVLGICGTPVLRSPEVADGDRIILKAQVLAPNRTGPGPGIPGSATSLAAARKLRAIANEITRQSPVAAPAGEGGQEQNAAPEGASGY